MEKSISASMKISVRWICADYKIKFPTCCNISKKWLNWSSLSYIQFWPAQDFEIFWCLRSELFLIHLIWFKNINSFLLYAGKIIFVFLLSLTIRFSWYFEILNNLWSSLMWNPYYGQYFTSIRTNPAWISASRTPTKLFSSWRGR